MYSHKQATCYSRHDYLVPVLAGNFLRVVDGPAQTALPQLETANGSYKKPSVNILVEWRGTVAKATVKKGRFYQKQCSGLEEVS